MRPAEHHAEAERLLVEAAKVHPYSYQAAEAMATRALAHAALAALPDRAGQVYVDLRQPVPIPSVIAPVWPPRVVTITTNEPVYGEFSGADKLPEKIVFQGSAVSPDMAFRSRHLSAVREMLDEEPREGWGKNYEDTVKFG